MNLFDVHLNRIKTAVLRRYSAAQIAKWITEHTKYNLSFYSYKDHEYQERILSDTSIEVNIRKCSQVGLSEASCRMSLALVNVLTPYTLAYTLPTAHFAGTFAKTRMDPVIAGSDTMKENVHKHNNNNEVKQFGDSFLHIRGAASTNAPISIPCDHLVHDEVDFSDQEVLDQYVSRLTHSSWKRTHRLSTPTLPKFGIDKAFQQSRRHFLFCKCDRCGNSFIPDYYAHVRVPGYKGELRDINKQVMGRIEWKDAAVICPRCGKAPSLQPQHREWVCENANEGYEAAGYQVTPFDAPNVIKPGYLIKVSCDYGRVQDFVNFGLGLPMEDSEATLTRADFERVFAHIEPPASGYSYVMGVDVGNIYHFVVAAVDGHGDMIGCLTKQVPMIKARETYAKLRAEFHTDVSVIDSGPHAETVMALQEEDPNLFASVYMRSKSIVTHTVLDKDKEDLKGQVFVRQVNVNRNRALDAYMGFLREGHLVIRESDEKDTIISHHMSMKRVKTFDNDSGEMNYSWQKTDGIDHYHHAFLYAWVASRIRGVSKNLVLLPTTSIHSFRLKEH